MNYLNIFTLVLLLALFLLMLKNKKNVKREGIFFMWRTKFGLKLMDKMANILKKNKLLTEILIYKMLIISLISFIYMIYYLTTHTFKLLSKETTIPGVSLVIPGVTKIGGTKIPFWTIIILFLIILIHEFGHGLFARVFNLKVKSSGLVLLGIIPGAFVEIDEKKLEKKRLKEKLAILTAGPFFNLLFGMLAFIFLIIGNHLLPNTTYKGVYYKSFVNNSLNEGILYSIDNYTISSIYNIKEALKDKKVGDLVSLNTSEGIKTVQIKNISGKAMLGINVWQDCSLANNEKLCVFNNYYYQFFYYLFLFNLGIGLANLLPFLFLDGGRAAYYILKELKMMKLFIFLNIYIALLLLLNLFYPLYSKFF